MDNPIKMDDLGVPLFLETSIWKVNLIWTKPQGKDMFQVNFFGVFCCVDTISGT